MSQVATAKKTRKPLIGPRSSGVMMTTDEFDDIREGEWIRGFRYELINGVLIVSPAPVPSERGPNEELGFLLRFFKETDPRGAALDDTLPEQDVNCTPNRRRCDRAIWAGLGRQPDDEADIPTIIVEFVSRAKSDKQRDYEVKRREYRDAGAKEYWIFDRFQRRLLAIRYDPEGEREISVPEGGVYQSPLLPGFNVPVDRILARADAWAGTKQSRRTRKGKSR